MAKPRRKKKKPSGEPTAPPPDPSSPSSGSDDDGAEATAKRVESDMLRGIPRVVSLIMLLAVVLLISVMFFRVMATFLVPLFLAAVLAVVFQPLHDRWVNRLPGRPRLAALVTTVVISLLVLVPTAVLGWRAYVETARVVRVALPDDEAGEADPLGFGVTRPEPRSESVNPQPTTEDQPEIEAADPDPSGWEAWFFGKLEPLTDWYRSSVDDDFDPRIASAQLAEYAARHAVGLGLIGIQGLVGFLVGLAIMIFALYYFFADGPTIIETLMHLSPLDDDYERELLEQFSKVSRAVVLATILSAIVQGLLAGVGYWCVLDDWSPPAVAETTAEGAAEGAKAAATGGEVRVIKPPVFLLTVLTMLIAIVPFVGAMGVWVPVTLWVYFVQGDLWPAVGMAIYGTAVVSSIDNVIKPYVLHGQSNLHPLLALLSVLGGLQLLGPIGILVGPMLVVFLQALLGMLRRELDDLHEAQADPAAS